jgi:hypothetical protein
LCVQLIRIIRSVVKSTSNNNVRGLRWLKAIAAAVVVVSVIGFFGVRLLSEDRRSPEVFTTAHVSINEATRHFFGLRPEPVQPIAFVHQVHAETAELECTDCHISVARGPRANIPDIRTCWSCHQNTIPDHPEIKKIRAYRERGEDIPWQRVYGWNDEAHVRFNHAPHIRAQVECATCHGDVAKMKVAERVVNHTMGFCVDCHNRRNVSNDCQTCHY